jgi:hypothetical protein
MARNMCAEATEAYARSEELYGRQQDASAIRKAYAVSGCQGMLEKGLSFWSDSSSAAYDPFGAASFAAMLGKKTNLSNLWRNHLLIVEGSFL